MSAFKSPYDREFELQAQEEHKAYQRGFNAGRKSVFDKIREEINELIRYYPYPVVSPYQINNYAMLMEDEVLQIIDKYKEGE